MASYKLAIAAVLAATVAFTLSDNGEAKEFKFTLQFDRLSEKDWNTRIKNEQGLVDSDCVKKTLMDITRGWDGQTIVIDEETGQPAAFCPEALDALYGIPGFGDIALQAYLKEVQARVKN
jgi:hypothetical protein